MGTFVPHTWERDGYTDALTCRLCLTHVTTLEQLESVESCPGPSPQRKRELREERRRLADHRRIVDARRTRLTTRTSHT